MSDDQTFVTVESAALRPLIEQNERQQSTITDQAQTIGRLTAEREQARLQAKILALERVQIEPERAALDARLSTLEAQQAKKGPCRPPAAPKMATDAATGPSRKPRQRRWWLRLLGIDE